MTINVTIVIACSGDASQNWSAEYQKTVVWPELLPVGSSMILDDRGLQDGFEWDELTIAQYQWIESDSVVLCLLNESLDQQACPREVFDKNMTDRGWRAVT